MKAKAIRPPPKVTRAVLMEIEAPHTMTFVEQVGTRGEWTGIVRAVLPGQPPQDGLPLYGILGESAHECRTCCEDWLLKWKDRLPQLIAQQRGLARRTKS